MNCYLLMPIVLCVALCGTGAIFLTDLQLKNQIHSRLNRVDLLRLKLEEKRRILQERGQSDASIKAMLMARRRFRQTHILQKQKNSIVKTKIADILNEALVTSRTKKGGLSVALTTPRLRTVSTISMPRMASTPSRPSTISIILMSSTASTPPMSSTGLTPPISKTPFMVTLLTNIHTPNSAVSQADRSKTQTVVSSTEKVTNASVTLTNITGSTEPPPKQVPVQIQELEISRDSTVFSTADTIRKMTRRNLRMPNTTGFSSSTKMDVPSVTTNLSKETTPRLVTEETTTGFLSTAKTSRDPLEDQILFGPLGVAVLEDVAFLGDVANQVTQIPNDIPESRESRKRHKQQFPRSDIVAGFMSKISSWFANRRSLKPSKEKEKDMK